MKALLQHLYLAVTASGFMFGLFFAASLGRAKNPKFRANQLLGAIFASFACAIAANATLYGVHPQNDLHIRILSEPFILVIGPLFYFYIQILLGARLFSSRVYLHFLPFFLAVIYTIWLLGLYENSNSNLKTVAIINALVGLAIYAQIWMYYLLNRRLLKSYKEQLKRSCSSIEKITQSWISFILATLLVCYTFVGLVYWRSHADQELPVNQILASLLSFIVFILGYRMFRQPEIFISPTDQNHQHQQNDQKYQKSGLSEATVQQEFKRLAQLMENDKPYMDAELNLQGLAELMQMSPHHLSQIINHASQSNFYEFINEYRIHEVKRLISDPGNDQLTVLSLALAAGFNSKATFNRFFKKVTAKTPTQFRKEIAR